MGNVVCEGVIIACVDCPLVALKGTPADDHYTYLGTLNIQQYY